MRSSRLTAARQEARAINKNRIMAGHNYLIISLLLLATIAQIQGLVCQPNVCDTVRCVGVLASSCTDDQTFMENASYCGCCSACVRKIRKGEICAGSPLLGIPEMAACEQGTVCKKRVGDNLVCD